MFLGKSVKMGRGEEPTLFQGHAGPRYRSRLSPATPHSIQAPPGILVLHRVQQSLGSH